MHAIQEKLIFHIWQNGLNGFILNPKNNWLIISGGYEEQLIAYLYHSIGG